MVENGEKHAIDDILGELGTGKFQIIFFLCLCLPIYFIQTGASAYIFTTRDSTYRCYIPECESPNAEYDKSWLSRALPFEDGKPKKCERYAPIKTTYSTGEIKDGECNVEFNNNVTESCTKWIFKQGDSIVEELEIPCEDWKRSLVGSLNSGGQLLSLIFSGIISDKYGRRNVIVVFTVLGGVFGVIQSFSRTYWMFAILEFFQRLISYGVYATVYVMAVELLPAKRRIYGCAFIEVFCGLSIASIGLLAWASNSWRVLIRVINIPPFVMLLLFFVLPESMRWLYAKGRKRECLEIIQKAAKTNGVVLSDRSNIELTYMSSNADEVIENIEKQNNAQTQFSAILKSTPLLMRLFMCAFCWFASVLSYSGTLINSVNVAGNAFNEYLSFFLITLVELPSDLAYLVILRFLRRKVGIFISLLGCGVFLIVYGTVPMSNGYVELFLYIFVKFFTTLSLILMYIFTTEIFPTNLRNSSLNFCAIIGKIGGILAPQVLLLKLVHKSLPMIVFGVFPFVATIAVLKLPETQNKNLPDSVKEAEKLV